MSRKCGRPLSVDAKLQDDCNKRSKTKEKHCQPLTRFAVNSKGLCPCHTDVLPKMKRLKTRKERSQMRTVWREGSKTRSHHQHSCPHSSKDTSHFHNCCHNSCHCPAMRCTQFTRVVPAAQEPSIITGKRLIGHHSLFNHEVKSVNIERLLSEHKNVEKAVEHGKELKKASSVSTEGIGAVDTDVPGDWKDETASKADDGHQKKKKSPQFHHESSDITQEQKRQLQLELSSGNTNRMVSPKQSPINEGATTSPKLHSAAAEKDRKSHFTPIVDRKKMERKAKKHLISTLEQKQEDLEIPVTLIQAHGVSPSPLHISSSPTSDNFGIQNRRQDPHSDSESECVSAVAARLCDSLQFPFLRKENLASESKEVLLKSLQERHGPWLQENLLQLRECPDLHADSTKAARDPDSDPFMIEDEDLFPSDTFLKNTERRHLNSKSSSELHESLPQTAEWLTTPVDTSVTVLDEIIRPSAASPFCMHFEPFQAAASDSFASVPLSHQDNKVSWFKHWQDTFDKSNSKEPLAFDSFDNSFMKHTRAFIEQCYRPKTCGSRRHPPLPLQAQVPDRYLVEPRHFPQEEDPFDTVTCSSSRSVSAPLYQPSQSSHYHTFNKFHLPSTCPPQRSHHTDMMQFPPSHILERGSATPSSSLLSPEQWSFPPMRLY